MTGASLRGLVPLALVLVGAILAVPAPRPAQAPRSGAEVYRHVLRAVGWVRATDKGQGTGWVVDRERRWLVTCYHVVGDNDSVEVVFPVRRGGRILDERQWYVTHLPELRTSGHAVQGKVLRRNRDTDLALVELASLPAEVGELALASSPPGPGDSAHSLGNRFDLGVLWAYGRGSVRQARVLREGYFTAGQHLARGAPVLVAQVPINEGDSGGPLVNDRGEAIGVSAAVAWNVQGMGLFIDVRAVRELLGRPASPAKKEGGLFAARDVYVRGLRSVAVVRQGGGPRSTGVVIDRARRLLLTTADAVGQEKTVEVAFPVYQLGRVVGEVGFYVSQRELLRKKGALVTGVVLQTDARRNLALIELEAVSPSAAAAAFAARQPVPGDRLHAISNPDRLQVLWVYAAGWLRQVDRAHLGQAEERPGPEVLVVQAPLADGDGGGPVLDERAELVGLTSGKIGPQQQVVYALTLREVRAFLEEARPRSAPIVPGELIERSQLFVKANRLDRALVDLYEAVRRGPKDARAYAERGRVRQLRGDLAGALADCDRAVALAPRLALARVCRAAAWCGKGEAAKALADCDAALALDRRSARAHAVRGWARLLEGKADLALADCDEAIWLDRQLAFAHRVRGQAHASKNDQGRAIDDFTRALLLGPHLPEAHRLRGDAYWAKSDVARALADYEKALARDDRDAPALLGRGRTRLARNEMSEGVADLVRAARLRRGLRGEVLGEVERRGAELLGEDASAAGALYRQALVGLAPLLEDRPGAKQALAEGLAGATKVADAKKRAQALREVIQGLRRRFER